MVDGTLGQRLRQKLNTLGDGRAGNDAHDALLFLGNWHESVPRALILDPILEAVDVRVYLLIRTYLSAHGLHRFPTYDEIERLVNLTRPTVARALHILRAARWISLCQGAREASGRFPGNVYAVHDEPLPLTDVLALDGHYLRFLEELESHAHARVRMVAHVVLETVRHQVGAREEPTGARTPLSRFVFGDEGFYAARSEQVQRLNTEPSDERTPERPDPERAVKILHSAPPHPVNPLRLEEKTEDNQTIMVFGENFNGAEKNFNSDVMGSSSFNKQTTTTTSPTEVDLTPPARASVQGAEPPLIFPTALSSDERTLAGWYLRPFSANDQQALLDELAGQIHAKQHSAKPILNPLGYLCWMCGRLAEGQPPLTSLGVKYRQVRERQHREAAQEQAKKQALLQVVSAGPRHPLTQRLSALVASFAHQRGRKP